MQMVICAFARRSPSAAVRGYDTSLACRLLCGTKDTSTISLQKAGTMHTPQLHIFEMCVQLLHGKKALVLNDEATEVPCERWNFLKQWMCFQYAMEGCKYPEPLKVTLPEFNAPDVREEYEQIHVLGTGAFGSVVLSRAKSTNTLYAIKSIDKSKICPDEAKRLLVERQILSNSNHPFVIHLEGAFETPSHYHFILEYCPGGDMYSLLESQHQLSESLVIFYTSSIVSALVYLHHAHIAYRDLKPENILLDARGFVRLADFGLAKLSLSPTDTTYSFCGSVDYMAPEVILGHGYGLAADIWSLGCVVYEMLTGLPPFYTTRGRRVLFDKICKGQVLYPTYLLPDATLFLQRCLDLDPTQRWTAEQLLEHPFLSSVDWYQLGIQQVPVPYVPDLHGDCDIHHFADQFTSQAVNGTLIDTKDDFSDFDWHRPEEIFLSFFVLAMYTVEFAKRICYTAVAVCCYVPPDSSTESSPRISPGTILYGCELSEFLVLHCPRVDFLVDDHPLRTIDMTYSMDWVSHVRQVLDHLQAGIEQNEITCTISGTNWIESMRSTLIKEKHRSRSPSPSELDSCEYLFDSLVRRLEAKDLELDTLWKKWVQKEFQRVLGGLRLAHPHNESRKCLVLDLDRTLWFRSFQPIRNADFVAVMKMSYSKAQTTIYVSLRPGVHYLLQALASRYDIVIFTASERKFTDQLIDEMDTTKSIQHRLYRDSCSLLEEKGCLVKDLSQLGRSLKDIVLLDDTPEVAALQPSNMLVCSEYRGNKSDMELYKITSVLERLDNVEDVRCHLKHLPSLMQTMDMPYNIHYAA
ncbi:kinase [Thraustotheca clavata]|uniref:Kinase n=1 Tax=Thraustotheca clavata TaxID=74557 RepID=A0A1V9ZQY5_9STRA|nr:kinase [Thraustotheca clavata]